MHLDALPHTLEVLAPIRSPSENYRRGGTGWGGGIRNSASRNQIC